MATTFTKILIHFVFSTKNREPLITTALESPLHAYMVGIATNLGCYTLALNGAEDHAHMLVSLGKTVSVAKLMEEVKGDSSRWVNKNHRQARPFQWQEVSIGESMVEKATGYIRRQKEHHRRLSYQEELLDLLRRYNVQYDERYIWT